MDRGVIATDATSTADEPDEKACQDDSCLCVFGGIELTIEQGIGRVYNDAVVLDVTLQSQICDSVVLGLVRLSKRISCRGRSRI